VCSILDLKLYSLLFVGVGGVSEWVNVEWNKCEMWNLHRNLRKRNYIYIGLDRSFGPFSFLKLNSVGIIIYQQMKHPFCVSRRMKQREITGEITFCGQQGEKLRNLKLLLLFLEFSLKYELWCWHNEKKGEEIYKMKL
jgi:hypothetical protein